MKFISMIIDRIFVYGLHTLYDKELELQNSVFKACENWLE